MDVPHPSPRKASGSFPVSGCRAWRCTVLYCTILYIITPSVCSSLRDKFHKVELLGQRASVYIILMDVAKLLSTGCIPSYSPTSTVWEDAKESSSIVCSARTQRCWCICPSVFCFCTNSSKPYILFCFVPLQHILAIFHVHNNRCIFFWNTT